MVYCESKYIFSFLSDFFIWIYFLNICLFFHVLLILRLYFRNFLTLLCFSLVLEKAAAIWAFSWSFVVNWPAFSLSLWIGQNDTAPAVYFSFCCYLSCWFGFFFFYFIFFLVFVWCPSSLVFIPFTIFSLLIVFVKIWIHLYFLLAFPRCFHMIIFFSTISFMICSSYILWWAIKILACMYCLASWSVCGRSLWFSKMSYGGLFLVAVIIFV